MPDSPDKRGKPDSTGSGVAAAMNRVLVAERDALADVENCRAEGEKTLEAARREARAILERAERVARDIHGRTERLAAARARRIADEVRGHDDPAGAGVQLATAVQRLAATMTGEPGA
jgi:vacuolar-type H+-ATPase subunit H